MKESIFTKPIFINPQAYLIIPELTTISKCIPFDLTTSNIYTFKINTNGKIEGKLLNNGNNSILHLDYYGILGNAVLGEFIIDIDYNTNKDLFNLNQVGNLITIQFDDGNIHYTGLIAAWSAEGKTNDDEDRATLRDLTGNGHDITLNGFAFSEMSGYGGYTVNLNNIFDAKRHDRASFTVTDYKINITQINDFNNFLENSVPKIISPFKIKVTGVTNNGIYIRYKYYLYRDDNILAPNYIDLISDGIYTLPQTDEAQWNGFFSSKVGECNITIELLPEYPDALVFDGVDDYGICENMPLLRDYTFIAKKEWFRSQQSGEYAFASKRDRSGAYGAFIIEKNNTILSFGYNNPPQLDLYEKYNIIYQNKYYYCNIPIVSGNGSDSNFILLGAGYKDSLTQRIAEYWNGAFYSAYLFDRSLDEQEIKSFIRKYIDPEYLLPSEIPTPDCYYDFTDGDNTATDVDTIKDLSGNGNDAVAYNFDWNEEGSGYKDGALYLDGVDDYIALEAFDSGFKTVFMVCKTLTSSYVLLYDQRGETNKFAIYSNNDIAYYARNDGDTYINNKLNTKVLANTLIDKKINICILNSNVNLNASYNKTPIIGSNTTISNNYFANMALYKFLGFKEALTEEQINAIIQKYNLLDGVDDIEVS